MIHTDSSDFIRRFRYQPDAVDDLAAMWVNLSAAWRVAAAQLEGLRLGTNASIQSASNTDGVDAVLTAFYAAINPT